MTIIRIKVSKSFDGTTLLSANNMKLAKTFPLIIGSDDWTLTQANGAPFVDIGRIPLSLLSAALTQRAYYLDAGRLADFVVGTNNWEINPSVPLVAAGAAMGPTRSTNPTIDPILTNLEFTKDEEIVMSATGGAVGTYEAILQLHPVNLNPLAGEMLANGTLSPSTRTPSTPPSSTGQLIWSPTVLAASDALSFGQIQQYDGTAPAFAISVPAGADNDRFAVKNMTAGANNISITAAVGQTIQNPATGAIAAIAVLATADLYAEWSCIGNVWMNVNRAP